MTTHTKDHIGLVMYQALVDLQLQAIHGYGSGPSALRAVFNVVSCLNFAPALFYVTYERHGEEFLGPYV